MSTAGNTDLGSRVPLRALADHPRSAVLLAAAGLSFSAIFFALSETSPSTATVFRGLYALPLLWWLARRETLTAGPRPWRVRRWAFLAGVFFGIDLVLFHYSIQLMGAGLATVLSNLQVVVVLLAAWLIWKERPSAQQAVGIPVALIGIVLISGVLGVGAYGQDPLAGSLIGIIVAIAYAAYLLLIRKGRHQHHAAGPILDATIATVAVGLLMGIVAGDLDPIPALPGHAWLLLLAITAQVGAGVMLAVALPRLRAATTSVILLAQPVLAVLLAVLILSEAPSAVQVVGVALVVSGVVLGSMPRRSRAAGPGPAPPVAAAGS